MRFSRKEEVREPGSTSRFEDDGDDSSCSGCDDDDDDVEKSRRQQRNIGNFEGTGADDGDDDDEEDSIDSVLVKPRKIKYWSVGFAIVAALLVIVVGTYVGMTNKQPKSGTERDVSSAQSEDTDAAASAATTPPSIAGAPDDPVDGTTTLSPTVAPDDFEDAPMTTTTTTISTTATNTTTNDNGEMLCNGHANLCDVPANRVLFATAHNAMFTKEDGAVFGYNHLYGLESAVEAGFRGINLDIGKCSSSLSLVHTYCWLGATRHPGEVFAWLDSWLERHPNEVVIMPTQIDNGAGGDVSLQEIYQAMSEAGNDFTNRLYAHDGSSDRKWPTLRALIENDTRVLFFHYNGKESCSSSSGNCPRGLHEWFDFAAETEFSFPTVLDVQNVASSCRITRGGSNSESSDRLRWKFFGVNVFLSLANEAASRQLNAAAFLRQHLQDCASRNEGYGGVNLVLVDFWSVGDTLDVVHEYNAALAIGNGDERRRRRQRRRQRRKRKRDLVSPPVSTTTIALLPDQE